MIRKRPSPHCFFSRIGGRALNTYSLPLDPAAPSLSKTGDDHQTLCLSLADRLSRRGLLGSAQQVIQRILKQHSSITIVVSVLDFATVRGIVLDICSYGFLIRKFLCSGLHHLAEAVYYDKIVGKGIDPDTSVLNSMVICYCRLGKLEVAKAHFDRLLVANSIPCRSACKVLLWELCSRGRVLEAFDYFISINDNGVVLGLASLNALVYGLCFRGHLDEALEVFDTMCMRTDFPQTPANLYKLLIFGLCKRGQIIEAELLCKYMESDGHVMDKRMYTCLIHAYCKGKKMKTAMQLFFRMLKMGCTPDNFTYNVLIDGFVRLGLVDMGWVLYNQMVDQGRLPDEITHHIMISEYCRERKLDLALILFNSISRSGFAISVHFYTVLIAALCEKNRLIEVQELYKKMLDSGVVPDHVLFLTLMMKYPKGHELHLALMLLQAVARNGCGFDVSLSSICAIPNFVDDLEQKIESLLGDIVKSNIHLANVAFSIFISALCAVGKTDAALLSLDKMLTFGCRPLLSTYNSLIKCLCRGGLVEDANSLFCMMQDWDMVPNLATYLVMVHGHCLRGNLALALDVLNQMEESGLKPNVAIYNTIIGRFSREKRILEAENVFKRMLEAGVDPDEAVYVTMIYGYSMNGRAVEACQLFDKMIEHGINSSCRAYTALINGLIEKNMTDKGCLYLGRMLEDGFVPNTVLYTALINQFLRKREFEFAFRLVDLMDRNQIEHDIVTYIVIIDGVCRNITHTGGRRHFLDRRSERERERLLYLLDQKTLVPRHDNLRVIVNSPEAILHFALELMWKIRSAGFIPSLHLYNGIISGLCGIFRVQDAYDYLELMQREGLHPNQVTFTILMGGHIKNDDVDHAIRLFNKMNDYGCAPGRAAYNTLIIGLCKVGRLSEALSLLHTMYKRGFSPNMLSYENLLSCLCASCLSDQAFRLFGEMISHDYVPRRYNRNWLLGILCEENKFSEAHMVLAMMLKKEIYPDESTKMVLVKGYHRRKEIN